MNTMFGTGNKLVAGDYDTVGYTINVADDGSGTLTITTTDKVSGAVATFAINSAGL